MNKDMSRMKPKAIAGVFSSPAKVGTGSGAGLEAASGWEIRPGGMLVQTRNSNANQNSVPVPTIKVRVKYDSSYHEITISSQASFGDLKRMLAGPTGLHPQDQKLIYKDKERDSKLFLDMAGVKDGSKFVLIEDELSSERRCLESLKNAKIDKASKEIEQVRLEFDKIAKQVAALESEINGGKKVLETALSTLIELLMTQLIKLDGVVAGGDVKLQRRTQVRRVQKYIETLDMLKIKNSMNSSNGTKAPLQYQQKIPTAQRPAPIKEQRNFSGHMTTGPAAVVTTKWETFDSGVAMQVPYTSASMAKKNTADANSKLSWEIFD